VTSPATPPLREEAADAPDPAHDQADSEPWRRSPLIDAAVTAVLGMAVFVAGFGGDLRRLAGPLGSGDIVPSYAIAKAWSEWAPFGNGTIGYPFGMELAYFPTTDILPNAVAGALEAALHNSFIGLNVVFALSFPVAALAALWVFRIVGVRGPVAIFASLAFTAIPFHWLRAEHLYLATLYSVVLGVGLALLTGSGAIERSLRGRRRWSTLTLVLTLCAVIATSGIYYACFTILLCSAALIYRLAHSGSWRGTLLSAIPAAGVIALTGAALLPASIFVRSHPALHAVAGRQAIESVVYSGNLAFALIPAPFTQLPVLKNLNPSIEHAFAVASTSGTSSVMLYSNFGSLFTMLALVLAGIGLFWSTRRNARLTTEPQPTGVEDTGTRVGFGLVGLLLATAILFFVPWGLNVVFAGVVTPQLRAWDRLVPVLHLLFFTAAMVAWRTMNLPQRGRRASLIAASCLVLLVFDSVVPYRAGFAAVTTTGQTTRTTGIQYAKALNAAIPGRCAMLELPYQQFPEVPNLLALPEYDAFWPALTNAGKTWSFGSMKDTIGSEWQRVLDSDIDASAVSDLVAGGFCGIHVDRRGLTPDEDAQLSARLTALLGGPVATGHGGDWVAYALPVAGAGRTYDVTDASALPNDLATFYFPPSIAPAVGDPTVGTEQDAFGPWWRAMAARTDLTVSSLEPPVEFREVTGSVRAGACSPRDVAIELRTDGEAVTTSFHLEPGEEQKFSLRLGSKTAAAHLVVSAPGAPCTNADQKAITIALHAVRAT